MVTHVKPTIKVVCACYGAATRDDAAPPNDQPMNDTLTTQEDQTLRQILKEQLDVTDDQITPTAHIEHDLGADSLDKVEIAMQIEERLDLTIPDENWDGVETVADLQEAVGQLLEKGRSR